MIAIARWPEYAKANFTPNCRCEAIPVERDQYEATWTTWKMPMFLRDEVSRVTCGWILTTVSYRPLCNGKWAIDARWEKSTDPCLLYDRTQELSFNDCEYYHPGSTHKVRLYDKTKLIPTLRILWLWLRLAMRMKSKTGERE